MGAGEVLTAANQGLKLQVAVSYGGRWDILQAARRLAAQVASGALPMGGQLLRKPFMPAALRERVAQILKSTIELSRRPAVPDD